MFLSEIRARSFRYRVTRANRPDDFDKTFRVVTARRSHGHRVVRVPNTDVLLPINTKTLNSFFSHITVMNFLNVSKFFSTLIVALRAHIGFRCLTRVTARVVVQNAKCASKIIYTTHNRVAVGTRAFPLLRRRIREGSVENDLLS